jgi:calcium permeable stress-gated cation channel
MLKNFNDKHNLYFAYGPSYMVSRGGIKIHSTAVTMTKFSVVLLLVAFTAISYIRDSYQFQLRTIVLVVSLLSSLTLFGLISPLKKCTTKPPTIIEDNSQPPPGK